MTYELRKQRRRARREGPEAPTEGQRPGAEPPRARRTNMRLIVRLLSLALIVMAAFFLLFR